MSCKQLLVHCWSWFAALQSTCIAGRHAAGCGGFCWFSRAPPLTTSLKNECWSHVSVHTRAVLCATESPTGSVRENVTHDCYRPLLIFSFGLWIAHFKSTGRLKTMSASLSTTSQPNLSVKMLTSSKTENANFTSPPHLPGGARDDSGCSPNKNWVYKLVAYGPTHDVLYLVYTVFLKHIWMSRQHLNLRKFHIKSMFLVSLKILNIWSSWAHILKWSRCAEAEGQLCAQTGCGSLPGWPRAHSPLVPLQYLLVPGSIWAWAPQQEKEPRRGKIFLSSQMSMVT